MRAFGILKLALLFVLLGAVVTVAYSLYTRRQSLDEPTVDESLLEPEIENQSTQFEHSEKEEGRNIFRVSADSSVLTTDGRRSLKGVELILYTPDGRPGDVVKGRRALYRDGERRVEFNQDVEIRLADGTVIRSSQVEADLEREVVVIDRNFQLTLDDLAGEGRSLEYRIKEKEARIEGGRFRLHSQGVPTQVESETAFYDLSTLQMRFSGSARVRRGESALDADHLGVFLDEARRLRRLDASGSARFSPSTDQTFNGDRILMEFGAADQGLLSIDVLSAPKGPRASYLRQADGGPHRLTADHISVEPRAGAGRADEWRLGRLHAVGRVGFSSLPLAVERGTSQVFVLTFASNGADPERLFLQGDVEIERRAVDGETRTLQGGSLTLDLGPESQLKAAQARDNVLFSSASEGLSRSLRARQSMDFRFQRGQLSRLKAAGDCRLESRSPQETHRIEAPGFDFVFEDGRPSRVKAGDGVKADFNGLRSTSRRLELFYRNGLLARAEQTEDFRMTTTESGMELTADRAEYDPMADLLTVGGDGGPYLMLYALKHGQAPTRTWAGRYLIRRRDGLINRVDAERGVATQMDSGEVQSTIRASRMTLLPESGEIKYAGNPTLERPGARISGRLMRLAGDDGSFEVEGEVHGLFRSEKASASGSAEGGAVAESFEVTSRRLSYDPAGGGARYRDEVRLRTPDLVWSAPSMDLMFREPEGLDRIDSWGGVTIEMSSGKQAMGVRASYRPQSDQVTMTGAPATVIDAEGRRVTGPQLIFQLSSDSLRVENPATNGKP